MSESDVGQFECTSCGKRYKWRPAIAGRSAKCACGAVMRVPQSIETQPTDDLYEIAAAVSAPAQTMLRPAPVHQPTTVVEYRDDSEARKARRFQDSLTDPMRDLYVPVGVFVAGFLAAVAWVIVEKHGSAPGQSHLGRRVE